MSCKGTHILEKAVQVTRHRRWMVLRSTIEGGELLQGKSGKRGRRTASHVLSDAAHQRIPSSMTHAVSPQLSRSDFVQSLYQCISSKKT